MHTPLEILDRNRIVHRVVPFSNLFDTKTKKITFAHRAQITRPIYHDYQSIYSKTCLKRPLKTKTKNRCIHSFKTNVGQAQQASDFMS